MNQLIQNPFKRFELEKNKLYVYDLISNKCIFRVNGNGSYLSLDLNHISGTLDF